MTAQQNLVGGRVPNWLVSALATLVGTAVLAWAAWGTNVTIHHTEQIAVHENEIKNTEGNIEEIKAAELRIESRLDRALTK